MSANPSKPALRWLEPFVSGTWIFFLLWTAGLATLWACGIGEVEIQEGITEPNLQEVLVSLVRVADVIWITLAALCIYAGVAADEGLAVARKRAFLAMAAGFAVSVCSYTMGAPLGAMTFTTRLGGMFFHVPIGVLLLWVAIVLGAREAALRLAPHAKLGVTVLLSGLLAGLTDLNMEWGEWAALKGRAWWLWERVGVPEKATHVWGSADLWQSPAVWALATALLVWIYGDPTRLKQGRKRNARPAWALMAMNVAFLAGHLHRSP